MNPLLHLDATPLVMTLCWWYVRRSFSLAADSYAASATNRYTLYLVLLSNVLQMYYYFVVVVVLTILVALLFKMLLLEQVAQLADGKYPFSVESILRDRVFRAFSDPRHVAFHATMFVVIQAYIYVMAFLVLPDEPSPVVKENQIKTVLDTTLYVYLAGYVVWMGWMVFHEVVM